VSWNSLLPFMYSFAHVHLVIKFLVMVQFFSPCAEIQRCDENGEIWRLYWSNYILCFFYFMHSNELRECWFFISSRQLRELNGHLFLWFKWWSDKNVLTMYNRNSMRKKCSEYEQMKYNYSLYEISFRQCSKTTYSRVLKL
jgi:hypothetical protein